jgi:membrane associated rhomboid family serine protease
MTQAIHLGRGGLGPAVKGLLIANVAAYLLSLLWLHWIADGRTAEYILHLTLYPPLFFSGEFWQLATYMFLHDFGSPFHLIFNMFILWMFGAMFEPQWGTRRFLFFYLACGLGGGLAVVLMALLFPGTGFFHAPVLGASAAVLGFVIAFSVRYPESYVYLFFMLPIKARYIGIATVVGDLLINFFAQGHIASQAHIGGMLTAYLLLTGYWRPSRLKGLLGRVDQKRKWREQRKRFKDVMKH